MFHCKDSHGDAMALAGSKLCSPACNKHALQLAHAARILGDSPQRSLPLLPLKGAIMWNTTPVQARSLGDGWRPACYSAHHAPPGIVQPDTFTLSHRLRRPGRQGGEEGEPHGLLLMHTQRCRALAVARLSESSGRISKRVKPKTTQAACLEGEEEVCSADKASWDGVVHVLDLMEDGYWAPQQCLSL